MKIQISASFVSKVAINTVGSNEMVKVVRETKDSQDTRAQRDQEDRSAKGPKAIER